MTQHFIQHHGSATVDVSEFDTRDDRIIGIVARPKDTGYSLDDARQLAKDILAACQAAESHFKREAGDPILPKEDAERLPEICLYEVAPGLFVQRRVVASAIIWGEVTPKSVLRESFGLDEKVPLIIASSRHGTLLQHLLGDEIKRLRKLAGEDIPKFGHGDNQGFIDQFDRYLTREEAFIVAKHAGQLNNTRNECPITDGELYSENLY